MMQLSYEAVGGAVENTETEQGQGKGVGQPHGLGIADGKAQQQRAEEGEGDAIHTEASEENVADGKQGNCHLDERISPRDALVAVAALPAQQQEADEWNIVASSDPGVAARAVRRWLH